MEYRCFWVSFGLFFASTAAGVSRCGLQGFHNISQCLSTFMPITPTDGFFLDLVDIFKPFCREGDFTEIRDCIQHVIDNCEDRDETDGKVLTEIVQLERMEAAWAYICDNLDELSEQNQCISDNYPNISTCVEANLTKLRTQSILHLISTHHVLEYSCKWLKSWFDCITQFTKRCGNVSKILTRYFKAAQPPVCNGQESSAKSRLSFIPSVLTACTLLSLGRTVFGTSY